jgi:hypothetical protein
MKIEEHIHQLYELKSTIEQDIADSAVSISDDLLEALVSSLSQDSLSMIKTGSLTDILDILSLEIHRLEHFSQHNYQNWAVTKWIVAPMKGGLDENKRKNMLITGKFDNYFQLTYTASPRDYIKPQKPSAYHNAFIDACIVEPDYITDLVKERFQLDDWPGLVKQFKDKIKLFIPLQYYGDQSDKPRTTGRVGFFGDLPGIFVPQRTLFNAGKNPTKWDERKTDAEMQLNVFDNLYAAIRSQIYTLDKEEEKYMQYKKYQELFVTMVEDLIHDPELKQNEIRRKLIDFAEDIKHAENFRIMQAKLYNLAKITSSNFYQDRLQIGAMRNKIQKTIKDIDRISYYVIQQTEAMKTILLEQEEILTSFHLKMLANVDYTGQRDKPFTSILWDYEQNVKKILATHELKTLVAPFSQFDAQIRKIFGPYEIPNTTDGLKDKRWDALRPIMFKAEILCPLQRLVWMSYVIENELKVKDMLPESVVWGFHLEEYAALNQKYPEMYELFFQDMEDLILQFNKNPSLKEMEDLFHQLRDPATIEAKIDALAHLK